MTEREAQIRDDFFIRFFDFIPYYIKPNHITTVRFVLSWLLFFPNILSWVTAFWIVIIGGITDLIDGVLARKRNQVTLFGKCYDPVSDQLLAFGILWYLFFSKIIGLSLIKGILIPESLIIIYIIWSLSVTGIKRISVNVFGRIKFGLYAFGFALIFLAQTIHQSILFHRLGILLIIIGIVFSWISQFFYLSFLYTYTKELKKH